MDTYTLMSIVIVALAFCGAMITKPWYPSLHSWAKKNDKPLDTPEGPCPFGCIFNGGRLAGDCRMPESKDCAMNKGWL